MDYNLYFHNDLDGVASGSIILNFLRSRGDDLVSFTAVDYYPALKKGWKVFEFKKPFILVDFLYHPEAEWWFDHHMTAFMEPEWEKEFIADEKHGFDSKAKSTASLIKRHLEEKFNYKLPERMTELIRWVDIVDSASFESAKYAIDFVRNNEFVRLGLFINAISDGNLDKDYYREIINGLSGGFVSDVSKSPYVYKWLEKFDEKFLEAEKKFKDISSLNGKILFIDSTKIDLLMSSVLDLFGYYFYPEIPYVISLRTVTVKDKYYHIRLGKNPWVELKNIINVGKLMSEYGGGGRQDVGAVKKSSREEILKIADELAKYINMNLN